MPHISEDEYKRRRRLAGIFTPYALKQIDFILSHRETLAFFSSDFL